MGVYAGDSFEVSVFSEKKKISPPSCCPGFSRTQTDGTHRSGDVLFRNSEGISVSLVPHVMLLGFHSQSNSSVQNNCYRGKMCLITESNALTMKAFQSIFLGQKKKSI